MCVLIKIVKIRPFLYFPVGLCGILLVFSCRCCLTNPSLHGNFRAGFQEVSASATKAMSLDIPPEAVQTSEKPSH